MTFCQNEHSNWQEVLSQPLFLMIWMPTTVSMAVIVVLVAIAVMVVMIVLAVLAVLLLVLMICGQVFAFL